MRFVAGRGAVAKRLVRGAAVAERHRENVAGQGAEAKRLAALWRIAIGKMLLAREPIKTIIGKNLLAKTHKNLDFVLGMAENGGPEGQKRTKTPILCSKCLKTGVPKAKSAQKPRFCARNARKWGFRRQKAHKNADFVLGRSAESGTLPRGTWRWVASARHQAPRRCCRNGGAAAVLPKW